MGGRFNIDEKTNFLIDSFRKYFNSQGYEEHLPSNIISDIDKSVYFIGSTISVFKSYILNNAIHKKGYFLVQNCLRTQNSKYLFDDSVVPKWASFFRSIGTISPIDQLQSVSSQSWEFFNKVLGISREDIMVRINSEDKDLLEYWINLEDGPILELDKQEINYYKHNYGMGDIKGRNMNFALRQNGTDEFKDIGNLIIIERGEEKLAVELAFGVSTILSRWFSLSHPIEASSISKVIPFAEGDRCKFADALSVCVILLREGLRPTASDSRGRILRKYMQSLSCLRQKIGYSLDYISLFVDEFEIVQFGSLTGISDKIVQYIEEYENLATDSNVKNINKILSKCI